VNHEIGVTPTRQFRQTRGGRPRDLLAMAAARSPSVAFGEYLYYARQDANYQIEKALN
jgi:hypothetical protein